MIACDVFTIIGTAGITLVVGIVLGAFFAAVRETREEAFRETMRQRYGNEGRYVPGTSTRDYWEGR